MLNVSPGANRELSEWYNCPCRPDHGTSVNCRVRMWRGGLRSSLLLPPLSFGGASIAKPSLRFHILLIEPDMRMIGPHSAHPALGQDITPSYAKSHPYSTRLNNSELCYPGVQQASVIPTTTTATTWVASRFPINLEFFLHFSMQYFLQLPYVFGVDRVTPISCTSPRSVSVLN